MDTIENSAFGITVNYLSRNKLFQCTEDSPQFVVPEKYLTSSHKQRSATLDEKQTPSLSSPSDLEHGVEKHNEGSEYIVVDWYDDNDPENPKNWSHLKKGWVLFSMGLLTVSVYMGSSIFTPAVPEIMETLHTSRALAILPLTSFFIGYGFSPMFFAPISEYAPLGRTFIYITTLTVFCAIQVPTALANDINTVIGLRLIAGVFFSLALTTGGATIADVCSAERFYMGLLVWAVAAFCGPTFGPLLGGVFTQLLGWRWTFWFLCMISGVSLFSLFFFLPETNPNTILHRRAKRLRKLTGNTMNKSPHELDKLLNHTTLKELIVETFWRPVFIAFFEPIVFLLNVYCSFIYIIINSWFEAFPIVFNDLYHFNLIESGLVYISAMVGAVAGGVIYFLWVRRIMQDKNPEIERFLQPAMGGSFFLPIGLFIFSWGASTHTHWIAPCIGALIFSAGAVNVWQAIFNYLGRGFYRFLASVFAGNCLMRSWTGGVFPVFITPMYTNLGTRDFPVGAGGSIIGGISVLMIAIPFLIHHYGVRLRGRSKYAN